MTQEALYVYLDQLSRTESIVNGPLSNLLVVFPVPLRPLVYIGDYELKVSHIPPGIPIKLNFPNLKNDGRGYGVFSASVSSSKMRKIKSTQIFSMWDLGEDILAIFNLTNDEAKT